ncbi:hypothetical protein GQ457_13G000040 [Hibiscus cannabinus]
MTILSAVRSVGFMLGDVCVHGARQNLAWYSVEEHYNGNPTLYHPSSTFLLLSLFFFFKHGSHGSNLPPGPPALPLIGHLHMMMFDNSPPHVFFWKLSQKYGPLLFLRFGFKPAIVVSTAKMAEEVLKTHDLDCCSRPSLRGTHRLTYNSIDVAFSPYNSYWREMRKLCVVHLFSRVQQYRPIREDEVARLMDKISQFSGDSKPVNLSDELMALSSTIICRVGFGKRYAEKGAERRRFHALLDGTQVLITSFCFADFFPLLGWVDRLTGFHNRLEKNFKELDIFYQELIDEHLDPNRIKPEETDIVDLLLQLYKTNDFPFELTMDHVKAILMNVFIAGTDTSAATVTWKKKMTFRLNLPKSCDKRNRQVATSGPLLLPRETLRKCNIGGYEVPAKSLVHVNTYGNRKRP